MQAFARALAVVLLTVAPVSAQIVRVATFNASLSRQGPGLLVQALLKGDDPQIASVIAILAQTRPDIILITEFDYDFDGVAAGLFRDQLLQNGLNYPFHYAGPGNAGVPSGHDLDRDGEISGRGDAFGYGRFPGQEGMLLLSAYPVETDAIRSFQKFLWADLPGARLPNNKDGTPYHSTGALAVMRLSSKSHWDVPVRFPGGQVLHILASHPTPPVFDGPEDRNGLRNHDEILFWKHYLDGAELTDDAGQRFGRQQAPFIILGDLNADPHDGDGRHEAITALLAHRLVRDAIPGSAGAAEAAKLQRGANRSHKGPAALDTADWNDDRGPGNMRVDYVLPSRDLNVTGAGVFWPKTADPLRPLIKNDGDRWTNHRLVWVDVEF